MKLRAILFLVLIGSSAWLGVSCLSLPPRPVDANTYFAGCYTGPVTSFPTPPTVTLVLQAPAGDISGLGLTGCFVVTGSVSRTASLSGMIRQDELTIADITAMQPGGGMPQDFVIERQPQGGNAQSVNLSSSMGFIAPNLQRCSATCVSLGVITP